MQTDLFLSTHLTGGLSKSGQGAAPLAPADGDFAQVLQLIASADGRPVAGIRNITVQTEAEVTPEDAAAPAPQESTDETPEPGADTEPVEAAEDEMNSLNRPISHDAPETAVDEPPMQDRRTPRTLETGTVLPPRTEELPGRSADPRTPGSAPGDSPRPVPSRIDMPARALRVPEQGSSEGMPATRVVEHRETPADPAPEAGAANASRPKTTSVPASGGLDATSPALPRPPDGFEPDSPHINREGPVTPAAADREMPKSGGGAVPVVIPAPVDGDAATHSHDNPVSRAVPEPPNSPVLPYGGAALAEVQPERTESDQDLPSADAAQTVTKPRRKESVEELVWTQAAFAPIEPAQARRSVNADTIDSARPFARSEVRTSQTIMPPPTAKATPSQADRATMPPLPPDSSAPLAHAQPNLTQSSIIQGIDTVVKSDAVPQSVPKDRDAGPALVPEGLIAASAEPRGIPAHDVGRIERAPESGPDRPQPQLAVGQAMAVQGPSPLGHRPSEPDEAPLTAHQNQAPAIAPQAGLQAPQMVAPVDATAGHNRRTDAVTWTDPPADGAPNRDAREFEGTRQTAADFNRARPIAKSGDTPRPMSPSVAGELLTARAVSTAPIEAPLWQPGADAAPTARETVNVPASVPQTPAQQAALARDVAQQLSLVTRAAPGEVTELSLRPEELGQVRMRLSGADGQIVLQVMSERPETHDLMRRHIDIVERAFRDLGYSDISFDFGSAGQQQDGQDGGPGHDPAEPGSDDLPPVVASNDQRPRPGQGRLDIRL